jgi:hypothetical protein
MIGRVYVFAVYHVEQEEEEKEKNRQMCIMLAQAYKTLRHILYSDE